MDGFVLPPFESTCILKEKDIICVKKGGKALSDFISSFEEEVVEKQPVLMDRKLLANEEFEKEIGGYQSENEDDDQPTDNILEEHKSGGKKRKSSKDLRSPKRKKSKCEALEKCEVVFEDVGSEGQNESVERQKKFVNQDKSPSGKGELGAKYNSSIERMPIPERCHQLQENRNGSVDISLTPSETKKVPSRSARRKKAKRRWLRELANSEKEKLQQTQSLPNNCQRESPAKDNERQSPPKDNDNSFTSHQINKNSDVEDEVVPIIVRPGHIRFEPLGKDLALWEDQNLASLPSQGTFQWNGITSKKKGQKWGKENSSSSKKNEFRDFHKESGSSDMPVIEQNAKANDQIDFDKLTPFATLPKEGDIVAYRVVELSSSWNPELSSFRVGKISWYDPASNRVILVIVPEYPIDFKSKSDEEASLLLSDASLYREDGSLEIDFWSLVDVRIIKHGDSDPAKADDDSRINEAPSRDQEPISGGETTMNKNQMVDHTTGNGEVNVWDELSQTLNEKKAELSKEQDGWRDNEFSGKSSWSYRALKGSALGPTMAFLRSQNKL